MSETTLNFLVWCFGVSGKLAVRFRTSILNNGNDACKEFQISKISITQVVGVTGSLLAIVSATSLFAPIMQDIHWIVPAVFVTSLILSVFTVFTAFNVAFALSSIISADGIRLFFAGLSKETKDKLDSRKMVNDKGLRLILFWVDLPRVFLNLSLLVYLIGLGLLQALYWKGPYIPDVLDDTASGLYMFIFFAVTVAASTALIILPWITKSLNESVIVNGFTS